MKKNSEVWKSDIEKVDKESLIALIDKDLIFNSSIERLKDETFWMFMAYVQSLGDELDQKQKDCVFHFHRLYGFYEQMGKQLESSESSPLKVAKKS